MSFLYGLVVYHVLIMGDYYRPLSHVIFFAGLPYRPFGYVIFVRDCPFIVC